MIVYLSGPITGLPNHNSGAFTQAARRIREIYPDDIVINPLDLGGAQTNREDYMRVAFQSLLASHVIVMLPGWRDSRGATMELLVGAEIGLDIMEFNCTGELDALPLQHQAASRSAASRYASLMVGF